MPELDLKSECGQRRRDAPARPVEDLDQAERAHAGEESDGAAHVADDVWRKLYKNRSSRKIDSQIIFS